MTERSTTASASLQRLPQYLAYLKVQQKMGATSISSTQIAGDMHLTSIQVRKDLAMASKAGRPKTGYPLDTLIADLERFLGYHNAHDAFLVGAGKLGRALLGYEKFAEYGLSILAAFDVDPEIVGREVAGKPVFPMEKFSNLASRMKVRLGILTVPEAVAQSVCDEMTAGGIRAIWNFSGVHLQVPEGIILQNENMAASFAVLSNRLAKALRQDATEGGLGT